MFHIDHLKGFLFLSQFINNISKIFTIQKIKIDNNYKLDNN